MYLVLSKPGTRYFETIPYSTWVREYEVHGFEGTWVRGYMGSRVHGFEGTWVRGYRVHGVGGTGVHGVGGTGVHGFRGTGVHGFRGTRVHGVGGTRVHGFGGTGVHGFGGTGVHGVGGTRVHGFRGTRYFLSCVPVSISLFVETHVDMQRDENDMLTVWVFSWGSLTWE